MLKESMAGVVKYLVSETFGEAGRSTHEYS